MLEYEVARKLYDEIKKKTAKLADPEFDEFFEDFLKLAVNYAQTRTSWSFMEREEKIQNDDSRSSLHNAYMTILDAVCRNLGISGLEELMPDRKTKGDFACYIALFLALEQR